MWMFIAREPSPDAPYWRGRRSLALVDAVLWPVIGVLLLRHAVGSATLTGGVMSWALAGLALQRMSRAWWSNSRYRFTTWRLAKAMLALLALGSILKIVMAGSG
jgi:hypothetical protein